jgi:hypothetical protein
MNSGTLRPPIQNAIKNARAPSAPSAPTVNAGPPHKSGGLSGREIALIIITAVAFAIIIGLIIAFVAYSRDKKQRLETCDVARATSEKARREADARPPAIGLEYRSKNASVLQIFGIVQEFLGRTQTAACANVRGGIVEQQKALIDALKSVPEPIKCSALTDAVESSIDELSTSIGSAVSIAPAQAAALIRGVLKTSMKASCNSSGNLDPSKLDAFLTAMLAAVCRG